MVERAARKQAHFRERECLPYFGVTAYDDGAVVDLAGLTLVMKRKKQ